MVSKQSCTFEGTRAKDDDPGHQPKSKYRLKAKERFYYNVLGGLYHLQGASQHFL